MKQTFDVLDSDIRAEAEAEVAATEAMNAANLAGRIVFLESEIARMTAELEELRAVKQAEDVGETEYENAEESAENTED